MKVFQVLRPFLQTSGEIVQIDKDYVVQVMETISHVLLKGGTSILKGKWHNPVGNGPPRGGEGSLMMVLGMYSDLIVT